MQVIAWRTVSEMICNVSSGMLNITHSFTQLLTYSLTLLLTSDSLQDRSAELTCSVTPSEHVTFSGI